MLANAHMRVLLLSIFPFIVFAVVVPVPALPPSPYADTEATTNLPLRVGVPGRDWHFDFQMSCAAVSNSVQIAFGVDADADGELTSAEIRLVVGRDATCAFVENPVRGERLEEALVASRSRVGFGARVFLRHAGVPSRFVATNEVGEALFAGWRATPPAALFDPSWNLMRVTVRGPTVASEHAAVSVGPAGHVVIFR